MSDPKGKVLVVDDEYVTVARLLDDLKNSDYAIEFLPEIVKARESIDMRPSEYAAVLIDIMVPRGDKGLEKYEQLLQDKSAQAYLEAGGQALGMYLAEKHPELPYAYISLRPSAFVMTGKEFTWLKTTDRPGKPWLMGKFELVENGDIGEQVQKLINGWGGEKLQTGGAK